jgi:hypothetical protein
MCLIVICSSGFSETEKTKISDYLKLIEKDRNKLKADAESIKVSYDDAIDNVFEGGSRGLVAYGAGGLGKSYAVEKYIEDHNLERDVDYVLIKGAASPSKVFQRLKQFPDKVFIFDDADSLWFNKEGLNLIKSATDSKAEGSVVSWVKAGGDKPTADGESSDTVVFKGKFIFITNLSVEDFKEDADKEAILTRLTSINLSYTLDQTYVMITDMIRGGKLKWNDFGIPKEKVTDNDQDYIADIYDQNYILKKEKITKLPSIRVAGIAMQNLKDNQYKIVERNQQKTAIELRKSVLNVFEKITKYS